MHGFKHKRRENLLATKQQLPVQPCASVGMQLTFRAEVMPGRVHDQRTFTVTHVLASGRVELRGLLGQHTMTEFEPVAGRARKV